MYESHWQLQRNPFNGVYDESFYYPAEGHQGALLKLRYAVEQRRAGALLSGGSGVGKTLLIHDLLSRLADEFNPRVHVVFPQMPAAELLAYMAVELGGTSDTPTGQIHSHWKQIETTLRQQAESGHHAVVVLDEAHLLESREHLEFVRLLLNLEHRGTPFLTLILVGQPPVLSLVDRMPGLEERFGVKCLLRPFSLEETMGYIQHRLRVSQADGPVFADSALEAVHHLTLGIPRRINRICDLSMLIAYADGRKTIEADHVNVVSDELITVSPE